MSKICDMYQLNREDIIVDGEVIHDYPAASEYMSNKEKKHIKTLNKRQDESLSFHHTKNESSEAKK